MTVRSEADRSAFLRDFRDIANELNGHAETLARDLLPNGRQEGGLWRTSSVADLPTGKFSLAVTLSSGKWADYAETPGTPRGGGDMLDLVAQVKFGGDKKEAIRWARSYLGHDGLDPARLATRRAEAAAKRATAREDADRQAAKRRGMAQALFMDPRAVPITDTPAEDYLAARGIDLSCLEREGRAYAPGALAFHPAVWCSELKREIPALIARILSADGQHIATHRHYLAREADGRWWKAPVIDAKSSLGSYRGTGAYIPLWKGKCRKTMAQIDPGTDVWVSEGIEDGLSVACADPDLRVIAAVSVSNMGSLVLPEQAGRLVIIAQNDPAGSDADLTLQRAIAAQQARGQVVAVMRVTGAKDPNALLMGESFARGTSGEGVAA